MLKYVNDIRIARIKRKLSLLTYEYMKKENLSKEEILNRIGYFRNKKNITAYKLGMQLGHSKTYFYRIESGEIKLTMEMFIDVLEVLGVTTSEFFYPFINEDDEKLITKILSLSKESKLIIKTLLENLK